MKIQDHKAITFFVTLFMLVALSCTNKKDDPSPTTDAGTFAGYMLVTDDPQTKLGYLTGVKVSVTVSGPKATVKITGDSEFDREYTGSVNSQVSGTYDISLDKQIKPTEKIAGERVIISNTKLTIRIDLANDEIKVKPEPSATNTIVIKGKLQLLGTDLLKQ